MECMLPGNLRKNMKTVARNSAKPVRKVEKIMQEGMQ